MPVWLDIKPPSRCECHLPLGPCLHTKAFQGPFVFGPFGGTHGEAGRTGFGSHSLGLVFQVSRLIHAKTLKSDSAKSAYQKTPSRMPLAFLRNTGCPWDESGLCVHLSFGGCVPNWACLLPTAGCVPRSHFWMDLDVNCASWIPVRTNDVRPQVLYKASLRTSPKIFVSLSLSLPLFMYIIISIYIYTIYVYNTFFIYARYNTFDIHIYIYTDNRIYNK